MTLIYLVAKAKEKKVKAGTVRLRNQSFKRLVKNVSRILYLILHIMRAGRLGILEEESNK